MAPTLTFSVVLIILLTMISDVCPTISNVPIPGENFEFEYGNFTLRNTTNIIRPYMIHDCSSNFTELYISEINIETIVIGNPTISLLPDINDMPFECE
eukprot:405236_1